MNVLVTGAAGVLGKAVTALLEREPDVQLRLTDKAPLETWHTFRAADLTHVEDIGRLCEGVDTVLNIAAIHPWKPYTVADYVHCNIEDTYRLLQAAISVGVRRIIYTSSIAALGMESSASQPLPWDEQKPPEFAPGDIYGFSKHVGEEACRGFAR